MAYEKRLVEYKVGIELGQEEYKRRLNEIKTEISNELSVKRTTLHGWIKKTYQERGILRKEVSGRSKIYTEEKAQQITDHSANNATVSIQELINWIVATFRTHATNPISSISHKSNFIYTVIVATFSIA